jgi:hypothetical protein
MSWWCWGEGKLGKLEVGRGVRVYDKREIRT